MQKLKKSKGFTLTELAIVIAVIAILIAVLVPTFISLINKANESSDSQLVKNLNATLSVNEATDGEAATMSDALAVAAENGYNVDKLTPSSSGDIVWDQVSNRFLLIGENGSIVYKDSSTSDSVTSTKYQLWYIASSSDDVEYSVYYTSGYSGTVTSTVTNKGIDVSALSEAVDITYQSSDNTSQSVIINGNGGSLTVNDSEQLDDIDVYNVSSTINGQSVAGSSLHLHGEVTGNIYLTKGHIEVEDSAVLGVPYIIALSENVSVSSATVAVKVVSGSSGVSVANIKVSGNVDNSDTTTVLSTETLNLFAGGLGTEECPYQISTAEQFTNISKFSDNMNSGNNAYYFCLVNNIDASDISGASWISENFCGTFEGNNCTISNLTLSNTGGTYCAMFAKTYGNTTIKDLTLNNVSVTADYSGNAKAGGIVSQVSSGTLSVSNVTVSGSVKGISSDSGSHDAYTGGLVSFVNNTATVFFVDCINNAAISSEKTDTSRAAYAGGIVGYLKGVTALFDDCINTGTIYSTSNGSMGGIVGYVNSSSGGSLTVSGCSNSGVLSGSSVSGGLVGNVNVSTSAYKLEISGSDNTGSIMGSSYAGGIFAQTNGSTDILNVKITDCNNTGAVTSDTQAGGISASCSKATFTIENCSNSATITGGTNAVGGLVGTCSNANGSITNCSNSGDVICASTSGAKYGGIVGNLNYGTVSISNCSNTGNIGKGSSGENYAQYVGGIVGYISDYNSTNCATIVTLTSCTVSNCTIYSNSNGNLNYYYAYVTSNNSSSSCTVDESCSNTNVTLSSSSAS